MPRPLREVTTYLVIAFLLAIGTSVALPHAAIGIVISGMIPVIALGIITVTVTPRGRRSALWASFGLNRSGKRVWGYALLVPLFIAAVAYGTALALDVVDLRHDDDSLGPALWVANIVLTLAMMTVVCLGEELGWRGYLLPRIQQLTSRRRAALITGFAHGCFHLPLILIATTYDEFGSRWFVAPAAVAVITMGGVFYAYLWDRTASTWPVSMAHGAINTAFSMGSVAFVGSETDLAYIAGESGLGTFAGVALVGTLLLTRAKVWRSPATRPAAVDLRVPVTS